MNLKVCSAFHLADKLAYGLLKVAELFPLKHFCVSVLYNNSVPRHSKHISFQGIHVILDEVPCCWVSVYDVLQECSAFPYPQDEGIVTLQNRSQLHSGTALHLTILI